MFIKICILQTSEDYPKAATGIEDTETALMAVADKYAPHAKWAVVTLGARGCLTIVRAGDTGGWRVLRLPGWELRADQVVDTTGAGDAFIGGLAAATVRGLGAIQLMVPYNTDGLHTNHDGFRTNNDGFHTETIS